MSSYRDISASLKAFLITAVAGFALVGCGGGGSTTTATAVTILDSFGQTVTSDNGFGAGDSGGDGSAGDGAAIPLRPVLLTDSTGKTATATTDSAGYYRVKLTGFTPPFVVKVTKADGSTRTSLSTAALKTNGFITINITGLTEKVASDVAIAGGKKGASELTPAIVAANAGVIQTSINSLKTQLASVITAAGVDLATFDPISVAFRTNSTGYDKILDNVKVTLSTDGSTVVTPVVTTPVTTPTTAFTGNWRSTVTTGGSSADGGIVAGSTVPTQQAIAAATAANAASAVTPSSLSSGGYTFNTVGNTTTVTGPSTNYIITINSFSYSGYTSTGSGAVGAQVSYTLTVNYTASGLFAGTTLPATTVPVTIGYNYVRVN